MQEFQAGDSINNRYRVVRKLGAGAMGSVYLCEDGAEKNIKVALKVLISENLEDQDVWAKGEYEALTRLRHPNLAKVHNFGKIEATNDYFIVSEFIKGVDLFSATEHLTYDEIVDIVVQICRSLEYIHSQGYVHFDVKPDNILVSRQKTLGLKEGSKVQYDDVDLQNTVAGHYDKPVAKLIDFGLAEKITGSFSFAIKGTLNYLAPEILNGSTPDRRADLYSLGVSVYQVVNRDLPFFHDFRPFQQQEKFDTREAMFEANMKKHPDYFTGMIMKLLAEDPEERFQSAKEVIQHINRHSEHSFELETEETRASYFYSPKLVGRKKEINLLKKQFDVIFSSSSTLEISEGLAFDAAPEAVERAEATEAADEDTLEALSVDPLSTASGDEGTTPHCVVVTGPMGSGKSRLLEEFQHYLKLDDINVYRGNCYEGTQKAYQPIIEILRELVCTIGPESDLFTRYEQYILKLLPDLVRSDFAPPRGVDRPEKDKQQFIEKIANFMAEAAVQAPFVFCLNNLHWIDDASVDLIGSLLDTIAERKENGEQVRILALASQRSEEQSSERLRSLMEQLRTEGRALDVSLRRLKTNQIQEFLQSMLGVTDVPDDFVGQLEEQTGGNPLFLVETLKALQDEGIIKHEGEGWAIKTTKYSRVKIPHSMEGLLEQRLSKLDDSKRQILEGMAVLNKSVSPKFLQLIPRFASTPLLVELRDLETLGIVQKSFENGKLHFEIEQPKVREILYSQLNEEDRKQYHREVGEAFEEAFRHREEEILEELAYHYQRSDCDERAVKLALRAGDRLKAIYANDRACEYYLYVLERIADSPEYINLYFEVREKLGDICMTMGRYDDSEEHYGALLLPDVREMLAIDSVTNIYLRLGKLAEILGDYDRALHRYKEARNFLSTAGGDDQVLERARVYNSIGWVYVCMGKYEKAMTISLEALRVIQNSSEQIEHAMIYSTIGSANFFKGNVKEAVKYHRKSLQIKENLEDVPETINSLNNLGEAYLAGAEYGESVEHFRRALATSDEIGDPYGRALTLHNLAHLYCLVGKIQEATQCLDESIQQSKAYNMRHLSLQNYAIRGMVMTEEEEFTKAEGNFFRVLTSFSKQGNRAGLCNVLLKMAFVHRRSGNMDEARDMVDEAQRYADDLGIPSYKARCALEQGRLKRMGSTQDAQRATDCFEEGIAHAQKTDNPELLGELHFELGETLVGIREVSRATQHYKVAEERFREIAESLPDEFRTDYENAQLRRFPNWSSGGQGGSSVETTEVVPVQQAGAAPTLTAEDSLRMVSELMQKLPGAESLSTFLGDVLENLFDATGAQLGYILSLSGRSLSIAATGGRLDAGSSVDPAKVLCLSLVDDALKKQEVTIVNEVWNDPKLGPQLEQSGLECRAIGVFPFLQPDGRRGALYLVNPVVQETHGATALVVQPFLNLIPMAYLHLQSQVVKG